MMRRRTVLALLLTLSLLLAACGNSSGSGSNGGSSKGENGSNGEAGKKTPKITIMNALHYAEVPDPKIEEMIEEKLNVDLDIQWIPAATYADRMNAAFATGTLTDIVNISTRGANREAIQDGQFWDIAPYLKDYPNLQNLKPEVLDNLMVDGNQYALYQGRPLSRQGIIFRADWAEKLNLSAPGTLDELYEMIKQFTENDPDGNSVKDTIGLADRGDLVSGAFKTLGSWNGVPNEWGMLDGQLAPSFMFPQYKETMNFFKKLRENGYINTDFPVTSKTEQQNLMINGKAGVYIGCMCDVQQLYTGAVQLNPDVKFDVHNKVVGPSGQFTVFSGPGYNHPYIFSKTAVKTEEELKDILAFMNGLMEPEIANLLYWGIEGEHYTIVDGKAVPVSDQGKIDREVKPYNTIEVGDPDTNGRLEGQYGYEPAEKAQQLYKDNDSYVVQDPTLRLDSKTYNQHKDRLDQIIKDATYNYMLGESDEAAFDKAVERWKSEGGNEVIKEYNASYEQSK